MLSDKVVVCFLKGCDFALQRSCHQSSRAAQCCLGSFDRVCQAQRKGIDTIQRIIICAVRISSVMLKGETVPAWFPTAFTSQLKPTTAQEGVYQFSSSTAAKRCCRTMPCRQGLVLRGWLSLQGFWLSNPAGSLRKHCSRLRHWAVSCGSDHSLQTAIHSRLTRHLCFWPLSGLLATS